MTRAYALLGAAAACFVAMIAISALADCDSGGGVTAAFNLLWLIAVAATSAGLYARSKHRRRLLVAVCGALLIGVFMYFVALYPGLRCLGA